MTFTGKDFVKVFCRLHNFVGFIVLLYKNLKWLSHNSAIFIKNDFYCIFHVTCLCTLHVKFSNSILTRGGVQKKDIFVILSYSAETIIRDFIVKFNWLCGLTGGSQMLVTSGSFKKCNIFPWRFKWLVSKVFQIFLSLFILQSQWVFWNAGESKNSPKRFTKILL